MKAATRPFRLLSCCRNISIHAAREGGDGLGCCQRAGVKISIHAAREGGDYSVSGQGHACSISIHAAREGGD